MESKMENRTRSFTEAFTEAFTSAHVRDDLELKVKKSNRWKKERDGRNEI